MPLPRRRASQQIEHRLERMEGQMEQQMLLAEAVASSHCQVLEALVEVRHALAEVWWPPAPPLPPPPAERAWWTQSEWHEWRERNA